MKAQKKFLVLGMLVFAGTLVFSRWLSRNGAKSSTSVSGNSSLATGTRGVDQAASATTALKQGEADSSLENLAMKREGIGRGVAQIARPQVNIEGFLRAKSTSGELAIQKDAGGRPMRITGVKIPGIMAESKESTAFVKELALSLGISSPIQFKRHESDAGPMKVVNYDQVISLESGETVPVFQASLRIFGAGDEAFMLQPELKKIESLDVSKKLTHAGALEIAKAHLKDSDYQFAVDEGQPLVVDADASPQQLATRVLVLGKYPNKLFLVGHASRAVIFETITSHDKHD